MPPSPKIQINVHRERYIDLCRELKLERHPVVKIVRHPGAQKFYGTYTAAFNLTKIFCDLAMYERDRLPFAQTQLEITLLHETRHAWQHVNWPDAFASYLEVAGERVCTAMIPGHKDYVRVETDAEGWAQNNVRRHRGVVQLRRKFTGGGLSKLAKIEKGLR